MKFVKGTPSEVKEAIQDFEGTLAKTGKERCDYKWHAPSANEEYDPETAGLDKVK